MELDQPAKLTLDQPAKLTLPVLPGRELSAGRRSASQSEGVKGLRWAWRRFYRPSFRQGGVFGGR